MLLLHQKKIFWLRLFQSIDITEAWSQMTGIAVSLTLFLFSANKCTYAHRGITPPILLMMIWGGLCPHYVSTYWHYITLNMTYHILSVNPNKRWAEKGRVDYLWNKAIWGKCPEYSINVGEVSMYVNVLEQFVKQSKISLCHEQGGVRWCLCTGVLTVRPTQKIFSLFLTTLFNLTPRLG